MGKHFIEVEASPCIYGVMGEGLDYGFPPPVSASRPNDTP